MFHSFTSCYSVCITLEEEEDSSLHGHLTCSGEHVKYVRWCGEHRFILFHLCCASLLLVYGTILHKPSVTLLAYRILLVLDLRKIGGALQTECVFPQRYTRFENERRPKQGGELQTGGVCVSPKSVLHTLLYRCENTVVFTGVSLF